MIHIVSIIYAFRVYTENPDLKFINHKSSLHARSLHHLGRRPTTLLTITARESLCKALRQVLVGKAELRTGWVEDGKDGLEEDITEDVGADLAAALETAEASCNDFVSE